MMACWKMERNKTADLKRKLETNIEAIDAKTNHSTGLQHLATTAHKEGAVTNIHKKVASQYDAKAPVSATVKLLRC